MIQRIQTIFLAVATLLNLAVYFTPIYEKAMTDPQQWIGLGLASSLLIAMVLNVVSVFLYNNRKNQLSWVKRSALLQVIALGFSIGVLFSLGGIGTYLWDEALGTGLVLLGLVGQVLALRFIKKDEELVRSMDRIR
ncbi:MAG: hypothetical protein CL670_02900 [Balneola sp.]|nr:hypothetical protein [Balneola sp.]MBE78083.1 hypothetical protein [Balneola sp.]HBX67733.1 DUF4293 domain-containing protein [Balneolaceae bacterium]